MFAWTDKKNLEIKLRKIRHYPSGRQPTACGAILVVKSLVKKKILYSCIKRSDMNEKIHVKYHVKNIHVIERTG